MSFMFPENFLDCFINFKESADAENASEVIRNAFLYILQAEYYG